MLWKRLLFITLLILTVGCGDDDRAPVDMGAADMRMTVDAATHDSSMPDAGSCTPEGDACTGFDCCPGLECEMVITPDMTTTMCR